MALLFDEFEVFHSDNCRQFAGLWDKWRSGQEPPDRNAVVMEDIKHILPYICIIDVISEKQATLRLVGTAARELGGTELTGQNWVDLAPPELREQRGERVFNMAHQPCGSWSIGHSELQSGLVLAVEYASFPIKPVITGAAPQLIICFQPLETYQNSSGIGSGLVTTHLKDFSYLDIGFGIPRQGE